MREEEATVRRRLTRSRAAGREGLKGRPMPGAPGTITHGEPFETVAALLAAAADCFARHNREPQRTLSIIGSHAAIVV